MKLPIDVSKIPEEEKTPLVLLLLDIIQQQAELIQQLRDEIARLKNHKPKPKIPSSNLEGPQKGRKKRSGKKRPGSKKRSKTAKIQIHDAKLIEPEHIPEGSEFHSYNNFVVQDIKITAHNTLFRLKAYITPDGQYICGKLPPHLNGKHFGPGLVRFILYQSYSI